jgi:hypothetical protein
LRHPREILIDHDADKFTFDEHYGGNEMRRQKHPVARFRRQLSRLKRKIVATMPV